MVSFIDLCLILCHTLSNLDARIKSYGIIQRLQLAVFADNITLTVTDVVILGGAEVSNFNHATYKRSL